jgi:uncharacterized membrane protein YdfJ with MMPL/SSD domain
MLTTLTARLSSHPRRTLACALAFVVISGLVGGPLAGSLRGSGGFAPPHSDSQVAQSLIERASGLEPAPGVVLLVRTPRGPRASSSRVAALARQLAHIPGVAQVRAPAEVSRDRKLTLITGTLRASADDDDVASTAMAAFAGDRGVAVGGSDVANKQINSAVTKGLGFAELLAFPLLLVLTLLFFRGRATLMPLAVGVTTVLGTFLVLTAVNHVYLLSIFALNLVIGMGLGLSIDYTLFLVTRYRQELAAGSDVETAIRTTMARAGRTVLFSAATVACALATLTLFPEEFLKSMGIAGAAVAIVAALAATTITPALLGLWGPKLAYRHAAAGGGPVAGRTPSGGQPAARSLRVDDSARWYRFAQLVMRRPGAVAMVTATVMVIAALPALGVKWSSANDPRVIPVGQSARTVADALSREFGGADESQLSVVITAPASAAPVVRAFAGRVAHYPGVTRLGTPTYLGKSTWELNVSAAGDPVGAGAQRLVGRLRSAPLPYSVHVAGDAAAFVDQQQAIGSHLPVFVALLGLLTFVVLWLMTGSVVLPLKALLMNALTVGSSLTPLVLIYQHGHLSGLLGYTPDGGVEPTDFIVAATVVFALSTDYGVFLLGRIKEARDAAVTSGAQGRRMERDAVATGLGATGRVITAAAILLAVAIGAFSTSSISFIQEIGVAAATGVLLDAFVVRSLLVPSLMALLGRWNWWSPRPLRRLHTLTVQPGARAIEAATEIPT